MLARSQLRLATLAVTLVITGCGGAAANSDDTTLEDTAINAASGLYDTTVVHDIEVTFDADDYDALIAAYQDNREKVWIEATVVIDGETYRQVGLRLKGNSSLGGLGGGPGGNAPINQDVVGGGGDECAIVVTTGAPDNAIDVPDATTDDTGTDDTGVGEVGTGDGVGVDSDSDSDSDSPETLPWLIRLDKFIDDQEHDGVTEFVVRSNNSTTSLNEAVALGLLAEAGLATQQATATRFSVNGSDAALRLVIENPNDEWVAEQFDEASIDEIGQLYKAEATGDWQYHGDDAAEYEEVWDQEAGEDNLTPLTEFLAFINDSTDEEFAAELAERLDVEAFARYLAIEDLMDNFDDIEGPGNNAYLYFDPDTGVATVVAWDHNLAFGGMGGGGPMVIGPGNTPGGNAPGGMPTFDPGDLPEGCELPDFEPGNMPGGGPGGGNGGPSMGSNILVQRFNEVPEFAALYDAAVEELTTELFTDGTAEQLLATWADLLTEHASDMVSDDTVKSEADQVRDAFPTD